MHTVQATQHSAWEEGGACFGKHAALVAGTAPSTSGEVEHQPPCRGEGLAPAEELTVDILDAGWEVWGVGEVDLSGEPSLGDDVPFAHRGDVSLELT